MARHVVFKDAAMHLNDSISTSDVDLARGRITLQEGKNMVPSTDWILLCIRANILFPAVIVASKCIAKHHHENAAKNKLSLRANGEFNRPLINPIASHARRFGRAPDESRRSKTRSCRRVVAKRVSKRLVARGPPHKKSERRLRR